MALVIAMKTAMERVGYPPECAIALVTLQAIDTMDKLADHKDSEVENPTTTCANQAVPSLNPDQMDVPSLKPDQMDAQGVVVPGQSAEIKNYGVQINYTMLKKHHFQLIK